MLPSCDQPLKCLLVQPSFSANNYWNYRDTCEMIGAKTPAPPLGLMTVAALLPQQWEMKLVDLNVISIDQVDFSWADIVCTGGMLPQQPSTLRVIAAAKRCGRFVAVGGPDPTSQPEIYASADAVIIGEGESVIPEWLESWRAGKPHGQWREREKPDVTQSPIPRFDLIDFDNYVHVGVQFSRGCPFNCEFCDIIELYGRKPRLKTPEQFVAELDALYRLGYRGWVDIVDDNFIGNKRFVKRMLPTLEEWCIKNNYPFFFSTEASMNLGDDEKLLSMMRAVDFRYVFMGIETPDPDLLMQTQKTQNTVKPITSRVHKCYEYGIAVSGGFIMGFDNEPKGTDRAIIKCVEETGVIQAMVGLLTALPNTQLSRRLLKEGRLIDADHKIVSPDSGRYQAVTSGSGYEGVDQTSGGLNFVTTRDRNEILSEYLNAVTVLYSPKMYFDRILRTTRMLKPQRRHTPGLWEGRRNLRGLFGTMINATRTPRVRYFYWRNFLLSALMGYQKWEFCQTLTATFRHFENHTRFLQKEIAGGKKQAEAMANLPPSIHDLASLDNAG